MRSRRSLPDAKIVEANSTCLSLRFPSGFSLQELGEQEQRVERRPQLVGHVREELRLVLRGQRELLRPLLERAAGELDLAVLDLEQP